MEGTGPEVARREVEGVAEEDVADLVRDVRDEGRHVERAYESRLLALRFRFLLLLLLLLLLMFFAGVALVAGAGRLL